VYWQIRGKIMAEQREASKFVVFSCCRRVIKLRRNRRVGHTESMKEMRNTCKDLVGNLSGIVHSDSLGLD
jgi:hypothetical protein